LFAQKNNGKLILRIEDTDQKRLVKDSIGNIVEALNWAGINFDEGPHIQGEGLGPYIQSDRLKIYKKHMLELIESNHAYVCFYPIERVEKMKNSEVAKKSAADYDKRFRNIAPKEAIERMENENCVVRLKMPEEGELLTDDMIRGRLKFDYKLIEDPIIIKSDSFPTYHFANVIDDYNMKISHVIRGEEWLPSLPKHIHLYNCFSWDIPQFAHLPLLLNQDKSKLSKRQGDVAVEDYIKKGYLKEALINFIALLGWHESNNQEFYELDELKEKFSLDRVQSSGAVFDIQKLNWLNQHYIKKVDSQTIIMLSKEYIPSNWLVTSDMIDLIKEKISNLSDIKSELLPFFESSTISKKDLIKKYPESNIEKIIPMMINSIKKSADINKEILGKIMNEIESETGCKGKNLWQPIRLIITGQEHGPDLASFMSIIGIDDCINRFNNVLR
tara:strand:- start:367 stop:1698 length:1332 start_codon:yes stop_codon:yes gene_type:complete